MSPENVSENSPSLTFDGNISELLSIVLPNMTLDLEQIKNDYHIMFKTTVKVSWLEIELLEHMMQTRVVAGTMWLERLASSFLETPICSLAKTYGDKTRRFEAEWEYFEILNRILCWIYRKKQGEHEQGRLPPVRFPKSKTPLEIRHGISTNMSSLHPVNVRS